MSGNNGYLLLWRPSMKSAVWKHDGIWKLWTLCLMLANWEDNDEHGISVKKGQFVTGRDHLFRLYHQGKRRAASARPCAKTLWRWLRLLETWGNLSLNVSSLGTMVTICNWERYQHPPKANVQLDVQGVSNECPANVQQMSTPNETLNTDNTDKVVEVDVTSILWTPEKKWEGITEEDRTTWAVAFPACDLDRQLAAMTAWLKANPKKAHKSKWDRFIVNWLTRSQDRGGDAKSAPAADDQEARMKATGDQVRAELAKLDAEAAT